MSVLPILRWPDVRLQSPCAQVADAGSLSQLAADMFETMYDAPGRGLAAPQVGVLARLFVMDATWKDGVKSPLVCINPVIVPLGDQGDTENEIETGIEACLSMPGVEVLVPRPPRIRLSYGDLDGLTHEVELTGAAARIAQHEADHLEGRMHFDRVTAEARAAALTAWEDLK